MNQHTRVSLLNLSCREATRLESESLDRQLSPREKWALRVHVLLCGACRRFRSNLRFMQEMVTRMPVPMREALVASKLHLSSSRRTRIKTLLERAIAQEK
jgi:hypothetical protein